MPDTDLHTFNFLADDDDYRDIQAAIVKYQATRRWNDSMGGVLLGEGEGDLAARILGEICRDWMEAHGF